jgi:hypothetical protein
MRNVKKIPKTHHVVKLKNADLDRVARVAPQKALCTADPGADRGKFPTRSISVSKRGPRPRG